MSLTARDVRVLADYLLDSDDWDAADHAYTWAHDGYSTASAVSTSAQI